MEQSQSKQSDRRNSVREVSESTQLKRKQSGIMQLKTRVSKSRQSESKQIERRQFVKKIIAAIDFGTSYTGFAYAFNGRVDKLFTGIHGKFLDDDRVPTVLLLKPNEEFHSFGVKAEDHYASLVLKKQHHEYRLFRHFKMALYNKEQTLKKELTIQDTEKRSKKAIDIFSIIIKHLKELILQSMETSVFGKTSVLENEIQWMLTIPAIWSDSARQFMREAAEQGGIPEKNLRLVLEPEAASLFSKSELLAATHNAELNHIPPGTKYIMADLGGGTVDICSHEILENGNIRELYRVQGGPYGGSSVNGKFIQFLVKLFGDDIFETFEKKKMVDYLRVMREFEECKRKFAVDTAELFVHIPQSLINMLKCTLNDTISKTSYSACVTVENNILLCDRKVMESFFQSSVEAILQKLRGIISYCKKYEIGLLMVVGGYAESPHVRKVIQEEFNKNMKVVLVQESRLAVLKGAVYMGLEPRNIIERRSRYTYGFVVARPFQEGKHPEALKFTRDGKVYCDDIFSKLIEEDQILTYNQEFKVSASNTLRQPDSKRLELLVALWRTDNREQEYCEHTENCRQVGKIVLKPPAGGWPDCVDIDHILIVGETEFTVKAIDESSGREYKAYADFL